MADIIDPAVQFVLHIPEIGENDFLSFLEGRSLVVAYDRHGGKGFGVK